MKTTSKNNENVSVTEAVSLIKLLLQGKIFSFTKESFLSLFRLYKNNIKGKSVSLFGIKIPLIIIILAVLGGYYVCTPNEQNKISEKPDTQKVLTEKQLPNTYDKDGVKVYDLKRCDKGVCGLLENSGNKPVKRVIISVIFTDNSGNVLAEGGIDTNNVEPMSRSHITIPTDVDFDVFKLTDVTVTD